MCLVEPEHGQAGSTQLVGGGGAGRPHADNQGIVSFDVRQSGHGEKESSAE